MDIQLTIERTNRELEHLHASLHAALATPVAPGDRIVNTRGAVLARGVLHLGVPAWVLTFEDVADASLEG